MFQPHEILARLTPEISEQFFAFLHDREKKLYRATIDTLAKQRKFRPVFIEQMPKPKRHTWMKDALGRAQNTSVSAHLLQIWFIGAHSPMLCQFLDVLGIKHDEHGMVEELPSAPARDDVRKAVDQIIETYGAPMVAVYLHSFQALDDDGGWPSLAEVLAQDERLKL